MKIWVAQLDNRVDDVPYNLDLIDSTVREIWPHCDMISFHENVIGWYSNNDNYEDVDFVRMQIDWLSRIQSTINQVWGRLKKVLVWWVDLNDKKIMPSWLYQMFNAAYLFWANSNEILKYYKKLLPNYDVFFEKRYFTSGNKNLFFNPIPNCRATVTICEDMWDKEYEWVEHQPLRQMKLTTMEWIMNILTSSDKLKTLKRWFRDPDLDWIFNLSSSPYRDWALEKRYNIISEHVKRMWSWFVYTNQVGAQDELVFDGWSMVMNKEWKLIHFWKLFEEDVNIVDTDITNVDKSEELLAASRNKYKNFLDAQVLALDDYLRKTWIRKVVIGLSGWIDSAISLYLLTKSKVLKREDIHAIYMPTKFSKSLEHAQAAANLCWVKLKVWAIDSMVNVFENYAQNSIWMKLEWLAHENVQARSRWNILMMYANMVNGVVINNSNKTELLLGYWTLYGDLIWFLSLIWDMNKREIYEYARWINKYEWKEYIPTSIIERPASAELREDQVDPFDYERVSDAVDELGFGWNPVEVALKYGLSLEECINLKKLIARNEFKKPPLVVKLHNRAKWIGRLYPVVSG